jgi:ribosomal protein S15P/S13E
VVFCLEHDEDTDTLLVSFGDNYSTNPNEWIPTDGGLAFLHKELARLNKFGKAHKKDKELKASIPEYEWEMTWR